MQKSDDNDADLVQKGCSAIRAVPEHSHDARVGSQPRKTFPVPSSDDFKSLLDAIPGRTVAARLRRMMPDIDRRVREGIQHEEIISTLNANGFNLNLNTFRSYLYRYRKTLQALEGAASPSGAVSAPDAMPLATAPAAKAPALEDVLDPIRREAIGAQYLGRTRPLFQKGKNQT